MMLNNHISAEQIGYLLDDDFAGVLSETKVHIATCVQCRRDLDDLKKADDVFPVEQWAVRREQTISAIRAGIALVEGRKGEKLEKNRESWLPTWLTDFKLTGFKLSFPQLAQMTAIALLAIVLAGMVWRDREQRHAQQKLSTNYAQDKLRLAAVQLDADKLRADLNIARDQADHNALLLKQERELVARQQRLLAPKQGQGSGFNSASAGGENVCPPDDKNAVFLDVILRPKVDFHDVHALLVSVKGTMRPSLPSLAGYYIVKIEVPAKKDAEKIREEALQVLNAATSLVERATPR